MPWLPVVLNAEPFWHRHRGPFVLVVSRPMVTKRGFWRSERLSGSSDGLTTQEEAYALLTDPRDTIDGVSIWSEREEMFVMNYRKSDIEEGGAHAHTASTSA